jgi:hypothetical protein
VDISHIPLPMLEYARDEGLHDDVICRSWILYVEWHVRVMGASDFRMRDWHRQVAFAKRDMEENIPTTAEALKASRRVDDATRKAAEDAAYAKEAVTFAEWKKQPWATWSGFCASLGLYL